MVVSLLVRRFFADRLARGRQRNELWAFRMGVVQHGLPIFVAVLIVGIFRAVL